MILGAVLLLAYLALAFISSAVVVRLWPYSRVARRLRLTLAVFPFLPIMLAITALRAGGHPFRWLSGQLAALFVRLSGRQQYQHRSPHYYGYARYKERRGTIGRRA